MSTTRPPIVVEASGAQVLPKIDDERVTIAAWAAHIACDADLRTSNDWWHDLAARLIVKAVA